jgi:hypothetical protein
MRTPSNDGILHCSCGGWLGTVEEKRRGKNSGQQYGCSDLNLKFWSDIRRRRASAFKLANETNRREPKQSRIPDEQILSSAYAFVGPNTAPNSGRILAH